MQKIDTKRRVVWMTSLLMIPAILAARQAAGAEANTSDSTDLLLNLFVEKGYVSREEAEKVRQEAAKRQAELAQFKSEAEQYKTQLEQVKTQMAALKSKTDLYQTNLMGVFPETKWNIARAVKSVGLFGDIRVRYEDRWATDPAGRKIQLNRYRYSLRFGLRGELFDDVYYGFRMETSSNPRSSWSTLGASGQTSPFGKANAGMNVGLAYFGWKKGDWLDLTVGKMPNPLYTTTMVWSGSLNPEGVAEKLKYSVGDLDLFANFGQFLYQDTNPTQTSPAYFNLNEVNSSNPPFMLALQGGGDYHFTPKVKFKLAPVLYLYTEFNDGQMPSSTGPSYSPDFVGTYVGQGQKVGPTAAPAYYNFNGTSSGPGFDGYYANQTGVNKLMVLEVPMEMDFKFNRFNLSVFGDYAQNLQGKDRARAAYAAANSYYFTGAYGVDQLQPISSPQTHDIHAYQIGVSISSTNLVYSPMHGLVFGDHVKKHAWEFRTYWQHIEQYSLDPNLLNTDFFDGRENMEGIYAAFAYGLFDNVVATVRYGYAHRINDKLGTGGTGGDIPQMNPVNSYNLFQVDLGLKF